MLDSGGAFLKHVEDAANAPLTELTATAMVAGIGKIGLDALNLGRADLLLPPALLRALAHDAAFPVLSANVVDPQGRPVFPGSIVKEVGGVRVGIFGLSGNQRLPVGPLPGRDLAVQDPTEAARRAVAELRRTGRVVVLLSQLGLEEDARLAREVPGIDVILGGFTRTTTATPRLEGGTLILHAGAKGMQLGRLDLELCPGAEGPWTARAAARGTEARVYDWKLVPLDAALPDHPALAALLERNREQMRERNLAEQVAAPPPQPQPNPPFVGAASCGGCHPEQLRQWAASKHARTLASLAGKRQEVNPECVRCHVTAFGEPGGYRLGSPAPAADLGNVQCEACHGFGREHRGKGRIRGRVAEAICRRCHTPENSPGFAYEPYLRTLGAHAARYFSRTNGTTTAAPPRAPAPR